MTALVGPSGGGKTTVSRLASRFWDADRGSITVGGMDISKIDPETLLSLYSIVFQEVTLFDNTILENIRIGRKNATDEEVIAAAKLANCDEFALKLADGWHSRIGENGCSLSGGKRQSISIARAFLKDAPIILLDEATASLDVENETLIQTALSRLIQNKTVLRDRPPNENGGRCGQNRRFSRRNRRRAGDAYRSGSGKRCLSTYA